MFLRLLLEDDEIDSLDGWVATVGRAAVADVFRARKAVPSDSLDEITVTSDPVAAMTRKEESLAYREALRAVPDDLRAPLLLRYGEGLRYAEIASRLGLTVPAAKTRVFRAVCYLKGMLAKFR